MLLFSVAKKIAPSGSGQDLDLDSDYYILYGRRMATSVAGAVTRHETGPTNNPLISSVTINPVTAGGSVGVFPKLAVLRFHGILMIIAWPLLALYGIFFASWMRPVLPNGGWFQVSLWNMDEQYLLLIIMRFASNSLGHNVYKLLIVMKYNTIIVMSFVIGSPCIFACFNVRGSGWIYCGFRC